MMPAGTICPCCGAPIIPAQLVLSPIKERILSIVRARPGITAESLRCAVWADDPGGGPECRHALYVHINQMNRQLKPLGIAVRAPRGGTSGYRIEKFPAIAGAEPGNG